MDRTNVLSRSVLLLSAFLLLVAVLVSARPAAAGDRFRYDEAGRLVEVIYDDGARIDYEYDAASNLVSVAVEPSSPETDFDGDGDVDFGDLFEMLPVLNTTVDEADPRDLDGDGRVTVLDLRKLVLACTRPGCVLN